MNELDLPCSDCGSTLVKNHVPVHELSNSSTATDGVPVADCSTCDARYYFEETIATLSNLETNADPQEEH